MKNQGAPRVRLRDRNETHELVHESRLMVVASDGSSFSSRLSWTTHIVKARAWQLQTSSWVFKFACAHASAFVIDQKRSLPVPLCSVTYKYCITLQLKATRLLISSDGLSRLFESSDNPNASMYMGRDTNCNVRCWQVIASSLPLAVPVPVASFRLYSH